MRRTCPKAEGPSVSKRRPDRRKKRDAGVEQSRVESKSTGRIAPKEKRKTTAFERKQGKEKYMYVKQNRFKQSESERWKKGGEALRRRKGKRGRTRERRKRTGEERARRIPRTPAATL